MKNPTIVLSIKNQQIHRQRWLFLICFFLSCYLFLSQAQQMKISPGPMVVCPVKYEHMHTRVGIPDESLRSFQQKLQVNKTAEFQVTYGPGAEANPQAKAAFQFALDIWANEIVSSVPIRVFADFRNLGTGILASAGPTYVISNFPGAPEENRSYPAALANSLAGEILDATNDYDIIVNLGNGFNWYFGADGNPGPGQIDFVTVALHEAGHGLGFVSFDEYSNGEGTLSGFDLEFPGIFSNFMINGGGERTLNFPDPSIELGDELISDDLFVDGQFTVQALGGTQPKLYAPNPYQRGSSISHWDENAFPAGDVNSLMSPSVGLQESNFDIGDITRGFFKDMGWELNESGAPIVLPLLSDIYEEIFIDTQVSSSISFTNISDIDANLVATSSNDSIITFPNGNELLLPGETIDSLQLQLDVTGLEKGFYEETVSVALQDFDKTFEVRITIRVLDGTEAPIISVSPEAYEETVEQLSFLTKDLIIENSGDADLEYSITIDTPDSLPDPAATTVYEESFEDFSLGDVDEQQDWDASGFGLWAIANENPSDGSLHVRGTSDGLANSDGLIRLISPLDFTPVQSYQIVKARISINDDGVTWRMGSGVIVEFNRDGFIHAGLRERRNPTTGYRYPIGEYFDFKIIKDREDFSYSIFINDEFVTSGIGFDSPISGFTFFCDCEREGRTMDIDNIEVIDGDENASFVSVNPPNGTVFEKSTDTLSVKLDGRDVPNPGIYNATITIASNDTLNSPVNIPVSLTVLDPAAISVSKDSLNVAIDIQNDSPALKTETFTISNSGAVDLNFTTEFREVSVSFPERILEQKELLAAMDMTKYGVGNTSNPTLQTIKIKTKSSKTLQQRSENPVFPVIRDSIYYDSGYGIADDYARVSDDGALTTAVRFDVEENFKLSAVRNFVRISGMTSFDYILEVYKGGDTPTDGELIATRIIRDKNEILGEFLVEVLNESISFEAGDSFWVVHKYPEGLSGPQGLDFNGVQRDGANLYSTNGGDTWISPFPDNYVILCRALSGDTGQYLTLEPSSGTIAQGENLEVTATFDASKTPNGVYQNEILINSNDPRTPQEVIFTELAISGHLPEINVSDEIVLFESVFTGDIARDTITIKNSGFTKLSISAITSDNPDITVSETSANLEPGDGIDVIIAMTPSSLGNINGIITIESDAANDDSFEIIVNGMGVAPPVAFFDPQQVSETVNKGDSIISSVTLSNTGSAPLRYSFPEFAVAKALAKSDVQFNNTSYISFEGFEGAKEDRIGHPVKFGMGTDNEFGYTWIDSDEPGGPVYNFTDITETGVDITLDLFFGNYELFLPFSFPFYDDTYESVFLHNAGFISFDPVFTSLENSQIPQSDEINNVIAGFWDADSFSAFVSGGSIHYQNFEDRSIVQFTDVASDFTKIPDETATFQMVLYPDGTIEYYYEDVETYRGRVRATVGIENADGTDGIQVAYNTTYIRDGLAVRINRPDNAQTNFITDVSDLSGIIPPGESKEISVTLDAAALDDGVFYDELTVSSNAPDKSQSSVIFELTVNSVPEIIRFILGNADTDQTLRTLQQGDTIDISQFDSRGFNVIAVRGENVARSVIFDLNDTDRFSVRNPAPYALGERNGRDFEPVEFPLGTNTVTATPYTGRNGNGAQGTPLSVSFEVVDGSAASIAQKSAAIHAENQYLNITLYPNPVKDVTQFSLGKEIQPGQVHLSLVNLVGQVIQKPSDIKINAQGNGQIDMSSLATGIYILKIRDLDNEISSQHKLFKE